MPSTATPRGAARADAAPPESAPRAPAGSGVPPATSTRGRFQRYLADTGGGLALVWLVYLLNVPLVLYFMEAEAWRWFASAGIVAVFLASYLRVLVAPSDSERWAHGIGQALLAAATVPVSPGVNVFWIYAAGSLGLLTRPRAAVVGIAGLELLVAAHGALAFYVWGWGVGQIAAVYLPAAVFVPIIGAVNLVTTQRRRSNRLLRLARDEVERLAAVAERERIARDLHDLLGHTLSVVRVKAELAASLATRDPERAAAEMREVEATAREALHEVRDAVRGYRARGLDGEVASAKIALEGAGIAFAYQRSSTTPIGPDVASALGLMLREAVTNVLRHADATRCHVELSETRDAASGARGLRLVVEDDGRGHEDAGTAGADGEHETGRASAPASAEPTRRELEGGNGLRGIAERARALGGRVETGRGSTLHGFAVWVWIPADDRPAGGAEGSAS